MTDENQEKQIGLVERRTAAPEVVAKEISEGKGIYRDLPAFLNATSVARKYFNVVGLAVDKLERIPPLYAIAVRPVAIDPANRKDVYQGEQGKDDQRLTAHALEKLRRAADLRFTRTRRADEAKFMHYAEREVTAEVRAFDGTILTDTLSGVCDLREGSADVEDIVVKAKAGNRDPSAEIRRSRIYVNELAETAARSRLIRKVLNIQQGYSADEIKRPFVMVSLIFTGEHPDPEIEKEITLMSAASHFAAQGTLYGPEPAHVPELPLRALPADLETKEGAAPTGEQAVATLKEGVTKVTLVETPTAVDCGCPDAPAGKHFEGCKFRPPY